MVKTKRHKIFVSYHHEDHGYKEYFCQKLGTDIVDKSIADGDIDTNLKTDTIRQKIRDKFIADATVTVVLLGKRTWQRKHVDWEIRSSLRDTEKNARCGLIGILLPSHFDFGIETYRPNLIPPRLADNCGSDRSFGSIYDWPEPWSTITVRQWIQNAFERRLRILPINSRTQFARNRTGPCATGWSD